MAHWRTLTIALLLSATLPGVARATTVANVPSQNEYGLPITAITGPATDNEVGRDYIRAALNLPAHNARRDAPGLVAAALAALAAVEVPA